MYEKILYAVLRGVVSYIFAVIIIRIMGRKVISQMTFLDFVVGVSIGSLTANMAIGADKTSITAATALATFGILGTASGYIRIKSFRARKLINSEPVTLIDSGSIVEDNMKRTRITLQDLTMKLREKNIFNLADVEFAIMEIDGQLSVLPKANKSPLTPSHMNIQTTSSGLMKDIIIDGVVMEENLKSAALNSDWLKAQLSSKGVHNAEEVFYGGIDNAKNLYLSKKNAGNKERHGKYSIE